jgi:Universal stress protein family
MSSQTAPIVVGYDGSSAGRAALRWATAEAVRQQATLRIAEAFEVVAMTRPSPGTVVLLAAMRSARERGLEALAEGIRLQHPQLNVETSTDRGDAGRIPAGGDPPGQDGRARLSQPRRLDRIAARIDRRPGQHAGRLLDRRGTA